MWGVGQGRWDHQHFFNLVDGIWTALCGAWTREKPVTSAQVFCAVCEIKRRGERVDK